MTENSNYSKGAGLIAQERWEQVHKHGWDETNDADYGDGELLQAALYSINPTQFNWPFGWDNHFAVKIYNKSRVDQLKVAGAFIAAEIDRLLAKEANCVPVPFEEIPINKPNE